MLRLFQRLVKILIATSSITQVPKLIENYRNKLQHNRAVVHQLEGEDMVASLKRVSPGIYALLDGVLPGVARVVGFAFQSSR